MSLDYTYCTSSDLEQRLSTTGVLLRTDDNDDGDASDGVEATAVAAAIEAASVKINQYCLGRYTAANLYASDIVNHWCIILACCELDKRRANTVAASNAEDCKEVTETLKAVQAGDQSIWDIPPRIVSVPTYANMRMDRRYGNKRLRVDTSTSTPSPNVQFPRQTDRSGNQER